MLKSLILSCLLLLISSTLISCVSGEGSTDGYMNISVENAYNELSESSGLDKKFMFLDVRTRMEFEDGHIPDAVNIPIQTLANRLNEIPKDKKLFVYCESGVRSTNASKYLADAGYTKVVNVKASMGGWRGAGYPIEK